MKFKARYMISDSETSNQRQHWQAHHFEHWFKSVKEPALWEAGKADKEIDEAKQEEHQTIVKKGKEKVQASLVSFMVSGGTSFGLPGHFIPPPLQGPQYHRSHAHGWLLCLAAHRNLPFQLFESLEFTEFQKELNLKAEGISGQTVRDNIVQSYNAGLKLLWEVLKVSGLCCASARTPILSSFLLRPTPQNSQSRLTTGQLATRCPTWESTSTTSTTIGCLMPTSSTSSKSAACTVGRTWLPTLWQQLGSTTFWTR